MNWVNVLRINRKALKACFLIAVVISGTQVWGLADKQHFKDAESLSANNCNAWVPEIPDTSIYVCDSGRFNVLDFSVLVDSIFNDSIFSTIFLLVDTSGFVFDTSSTGIFLWDSIGVYEIRVFNAPDSLFPSLSLPLPIDSFSCDTSLFCCALDSGLFLAIDTLPPSILGPDTLTQFVQTGNCAIVLDLDSLPIIENGIFPPILTSSSISNGSLLSPGFHQLGVWVEDSCGNADSLSLTIWVRDTIPPQIACPNDTVVYLGLDSCTTVVHWGAVTGIDDCSPVQINTNFNSGDIFPYGIHEIISTASDTFGNTTTCSFFITVADTIPPTISCPQDTIIYLPSNLCEIPFSWSILSSDNCNLDDTSSLTPFLVDLPLGDSLISVMVTDTAGNQSSCNFLVSIRDTFPPILNCQNDVTISTDPGNCTATYNWSISGFDACGFGLIQPAPPSPLILPLGVNTIEYVVADISGNQDSCSFQVIVEDQEFPIISGCNSIQQNTDPGVCTAVVTWPTIQMSDNCFVAVRDSNFASGSTFSLGTTSVNYSAEDSAGNITTCAFSITILDQEAPVIFDRPRDTTLYLDSLSCEISYSWSLPFATDNCDVPTYSSSNQPGDIFPLGLTNISYEFTDASGNIATGSFIVTVVDTIIPQIFDTPSDIVMDNDSGLCGAIIDWDEAFSTDNCQVTTFGSQPFVSGNFFEVGEHDVFYIAVDTVGNRDTTSFKVQVNDVEAPLFLDCPGPKVFFATDTTCNVLVDWENPLIFENCQLGETYWYITNAPEDTFFFDPVTDIFSEEVLLTSTGGIDVVYVAVDTSENQSQCTFSVMLEDTIPPVITPGTCILDTIIVYADSLFCGGMYEWQIPSGIDNCGEVKRESAQSPSDTLDVGFNPIEISLIDGQGNVASCSFVIEVIDTIAPQPIFCPHDTLIYLSADTCMAQATWEEPVFFDGCSYTLSTAAPYESGDFFPPGDTTIIYFATDSSGNVGVCSFKISVKDTTPPRITICEDQSRFVDSQSCVLVANDFVQFTDNCNAEVTYDPPGPYGVGDYRIKAVVQDVGGNIDSCFFDLDVNSTVNLSLSRDTIICRGDQIVLTASGAPNFIWAADNLNDSSLSALDIANPIASPRMTTLYEVTGYDEFCEEKEFIQVEVFAALTTEGYAEDSAICEGEEVSLFGTGGTFYDWNFGSSVEQVLVLPNMDSTDFPRDSIFSYVVIAYDEDYKCDGGYDTVDVRVFRRPQACFQLNPTEGTLPGSVEVFDCSQFAETSFWYGNGTLLRAFNNIWPVPDTGINTVELIVEGENQCRDTLKKEVYFLPALVSVPTAFSPNEDGFNDIFKIGYSGLVEPDDFEIKIFNRWGELVFSSLNPEFTWEGICNGKACPEGVYVWILQTKAVDGRHIPREGTVTIIR